MTQLSAGSECGCLATITINDALAEERNPLGLDSYLSPCLCISGMHYAGHTNTSNSNLRPEDQVNMAIAVLTGVDLTAFFNIKNLYPSLKNTLVDNLVNDLVSFARHEELAAELKGFSGWVQSTNLTDRFGWSWSAFVLAYFVI